MPLVLETAQPILYTRAGRQAAPDMSKFCWLCGLVIDKIASPSYSPAKRFAAVIAALI